MSGSNVRVVDTNILIYYLSGVQEVEQYFFDYQPIISFVAEFELLSFPGISGEHLQLFESFYQLR